MKNEASRETPKKLHGNNAKIDPAKHVESLYQSNPITRPSYWPNGIPMMDDEDVDNARHFVQENQK